MGPRSNFPNVEHSVFFSNIPYTTTAGYLRKIFSKAGAVEDVELFTDARGSSIGAGIVAFSSSSATQAALDMDGCNVDGRPMAVKVNEREGKGAKGAGKGSPEARVFFNGVPYTTTEGYLRARFEKFGTILDFDLWRRPDGASQGMGTCAYSSASEAQQAITSLSESVVDGRFIIVQPDSRPEERSSEAGEKSLASNGGSQKGGKSGKGSLKGYAAYHGEKGRSGNRVFWSNVPLETTEGYLRAQFERLGTILDFDFWRKEDGTSQGMGTCQFDHHLGVRRVLEQLHGQSIDGKDIRIKEDTGGRTGYVPPTVKGGYFAKGKGTGVGSGKGKGKWY